jgi:hypothetical protein
MVARHMKTTGFEPTDACQPDGLARFGYIDRSQRIETIYKVL